MRREIAAAIALTVAACDKPAEPTQTFTPKQVEQTAADGQFAEHVRIARIMRARGVARIEEVGERTALGGMRARLVGAGGAELGSVIVEYSEDGNETIRIAAWGEDIETRLGATTTTVDHVRGVTGTVTGHVDEATGDVQLVEDEGMARIKALVPEDIVLLAMGVSSVLHLGLRAEGTAIEADDGKKKDELVMCTGRVVGSSSAHRLASWCCEGAYRANGPKCSNAYCWGCCSRRMCNRICTWGDFGACYCYAESQACGGSSWR